METPPADITRIIEALSECSKDFILYWDEKGNPEVESGNSPDMLIEALVNLFDLLYTHEVGDKKLTLDELSELGQYGMNLLQALSLDTESIGYEGHQYFEDISFPLGLWLARNQAEITSLDPMVNTLARMANRLVNPEELEALFTQSSEIYDAVSITLMQDLEQRQQNSAWAIFLVNRGIIATRTLNPAIIELAYSTIAEYLPEISHNFFTEGMEQMELLDYPQRVREVVERYYTQSKTLQVLH